MVRDVFCRLSGVAGWSWGQVCVRGKGGDPHWFLLVGSCRGGDKWLYLA